MQRRILRETFADPTTNQFIGRFLIELFKCTNAVLESAVKHVPEKGIDNTAENHDLDTLRARATQTRVGLRGKLRLSRYFSKVLLKKTIVKLWILNLQPIEDEECHPARPKMLEQVVAVGKGSAPSYHQRERSNPANRRIFLTGDAVEVVTVSQGDGSKTDVGLSAVVKHHPFVRMIRHYIDRSKFWMAQDGVGSSMYRPGKVTMRVPRDPIDVLWQCVALAIELDDLRTGDLVCGKRTIRIDSSLAVRRGHSLNVAPRPHGANARNAAAKTFAQRRMVSGGKESPAIVHPLCKRCEFGVVGDWTSS